MRKVDINSERRLLLAGNCLDSERPAWQLREI